MHIKNIMIHLKSYTKKGDNMGNNYIQRSRSAADVDKLFGGAIATYQTQHFNEFSLTKRFIL